MLWSSVALVLITDRYEGRKNRRTTRERERKESGEEIVIVQEGRKDNWRRVEYAFRARIEIRNENSREFLPLFINCELRNSRVAEGTSFLIPLRS